MKVYLAIILLLLGPYLMAPVSAYYSTGNLDDPALCGAECANDLSDFPYWSRQTTHHGTNDGSPGNQTSYTYYGTFGTVGWILASSHTGTNVYGNTYTFLYGPYAGNLYVATGRIIDGNVDHQPDPIEVNGPYFPNWIEIAEVQEAPNCISEDNPDICCIGEDAGDGTCSGGVCGTGCSTDPIPNLIPMPTITINKLTPGDILLAIGAGTGASSNQEWYLECNSDVNRGGTGTVDPCCSGMQFTGTTPRAPSTSVNPLTPSWSSFGGIGTNCDADAGYTYLGSIPGGLGKWTLGRMHTNSMPYNIWHYGTQPNCFATWDMWDGTRIIEGNSPPPNATPSNLVPPIPRFGSGPLADCGHAGVQSGDSGASTYVKHDGVWYFLGTEAPMDPTPVQDYRWWWFPFVYGIESGGVGAP